MDWARRMVPRNYFLRHGGSAELLKAGWIHVVCGVSGHGFRRNAKEKNRLFAQHYMVMLSWTSDFCCHIFR